MSKHEGNILVPLLAATALVAIIIALYFLWQTQNFQSKSLVELTPTPTVLSKRGENANWKQFAFKENSVYFEYPSNLELKYYPPNISANFDGDRMASDENAVLKSGSTKILGINPDQVGLALPDSKKVPEKFTIDGKVGTKIVGEKGYMAIVNYANNKYLFLSCHSEAILCDQILSTFKFTSQNLSENSSGSICESEGGKWLAEYNECELDGSSDSADQAACAKLKGKYINCATECRHIKTYPSNLPCVPSCVRVCQL